MILVLVGLIWMGGGGGGRNLLHIYDLESIPLCSLLPGTPEGKTCVNIAMIAVSLHNLYPLE